MKVALVYDRVNKWGGAERVLLALKEIFPNAPLYTSLYSPKNAQWADTFDVRSSFLQKIPFAQNHHDILASLMPLGFENFTFDEFDLVISITSEAAKGILTKPHTKHLCICLTPTRYLWSGYDEYFSNPLLRFVSFPVVKYLKNWDTIAAQRPDNLVAISNEVKIRINKYYHRDSEVIYPPVTLGSNKLYKKQIKPQNDSEYFLVVSRLVPYKRIDLAIEACNELGLPLKIIGSGSEEKHLRNIAGPTISFVGNVSDDALIDYYQYCKALIFPGYEDFGISIVEAQRFGKPVIAYKKGGALETIIENKTGLFFPKQTKQSLIDTLHTFEQMHFDPEACITQSEKFSQESFASQMKEIIKKVFA